VREFIAAGPEGRAKALDVAAFSLPSALLSAWSDVYAS
jgi:hypothetical protein